MIHTIQYFRCVTLMILYYCIAFGTCISSTVACVQRPKRYPMKTTKNNYNQESGYFSTLFLIFFFCIKFVLETYINILCYNKILSIVFSPMVHGDRWEQILKVKPPVINLDIPLQCPQMVKPLRLVRSIMME
jgi:hypothetical protein